MISDKLKELEALREKAAKLEAAVAEERQARFKNLPAEYGFDDVEDFIAAVREASGGRARRGRKPGRPAAAPKSGGPRRRRATITDETRANVKKMVEAGKTGAEIAKAVGISLPSVQNIKKALGLVGKHSKK